MEDTNSKEFVKRWFLDAARFCCSKAIFLFRTFLHILMLHVQTMNRKLKGNDIRDNAAVLSDSRLNERRNTLETKIARNQTIKITMPYARVDNVLCLSGQ